MTMCYNRMRNCVSARADSYREEGNDLFKKKDYRVAIENYTEGIKSKSPDRLQNAILYTNRAAAQYRLGNQRAFWTFNSGQSNIAWSVTLCHECIMCTAPSYLTDCLKLYIAISFCTIHAASNTLSLQIPCTMTQLSVLAPFPFLAPDNYFAKMVDLPCVSLLCCCFPHP